MITRRANAIQDWKTFLTFRTQLTLTNFDYDLRPVLENEQVLLNGVYLSNQVGHSLNPGQLNGINRILWTVGAGFECH